MSKNQSLLSMMHPQAQKKVLELIKRLGDEKQAKDQALKQCSQYEAEISELKKELEKLKKENVSLKAKWQNSFEMISRVRENFGSGKKGQGQREMSGNKKLRFNKEQQNWEEQSEEEDQSTYDQVRSNNVQKQSVMKPQHKQEQSIPNYPKPGANFSIDPPSTFIETSRSSQQASQHPQNYLPQTTAKKPPRPNLQSQEKYNNSLSKSKLNMTARSNKKLEIECLKQEIQKLAEDMRVKETGGMSLDDKIRKCEEIKSRYRKGPKEAESGHDNVAMSQYQQANSSIVMSGYYSPRKQSHAQKNSHHPQETFINQLSSNKKPSPQVFTNSSQQKPSPLTQTFQSHQAQIQKQNIRMNSSYHNQLNNSYLQGNMTNDLVMMGQQLMRNGAKQTGSKKVPSTVRSGVQESFYDEGLLDLIAEMNP